VSDGTRTRGHLDHNQVLYQLSYTHHGTLHTPMGFSGEKKSSGHDSLRRTRKPTDEPAAGGADDAVKPRSETRSAADAEVASGRKGREQPYAVGSPGEASEPPCAAAIARAVSESGPGTGTKIVAR
jgi:hypothetical protein